MKRERDKAWLETAAAAENQWVRAVVLKDDHVAHADARQIAIEASDMAQKALGASHELYGVSLLNLGIYYEVVERNGTEALRHYQQALRVLGNDHPEYVEAMYWLGIYQFNTDNGKDRAVEVWTESVAILRRRSEKTTRMAALLICLSCFYLSQHPKIAVQQLHEALEIQRKELGPSHASVRDTESRMAAALRAAAAFD